MLGRNQEVQKTAQGVPLVAAVDDLEELAEESGGGGFIGGIQRREEVLD